MKRLFYLLREAITGLRQNGGTTIIGVLTTAFTMASFGVFLLLYLNVQNVVGSLQDHIQVVVFVHHTATKQDIANLRRALNKEPAIENISFISKDQALKDFHQAFPNEAYLLDGIGDNPLPASFLATVAQSSSTPTDVSTLAQRIKNFPEVEHVRYNQEWVEWLTLVTSYIQLAAIIMGIILSIASLTIIANTVRLAVYARREEIEILRLIGATGTFIAIPYVVEGAVLGAMGGGLSVGLLRGGFEMFQEKIHGVSWMGELPSAIEFFPLQLSMMLILAGMALGCTGSILSVYGWMKVRT